MGGIIDSIWGVVDDVATLVTDTVKNVIEDPLPAIIAVGGMMVGIPPIYAGALAGGVGAAEHGGNILEGALVGGLSGACLLYTSPSPRDRQRSRMPSSA